MSTSSFWRQLIVAFALSVFGALLHTALALLFGSSIAFRLTLLVVSGIYVSILLSSATVRNGRVLAAATWMALSAALLVFNPALIVWLLAQLGFIWLLRSLQRYQNLISAAADGLICALALTASVATARHSGSLFLSLWSFFLVQALLAFMPVTAGGTGPAPEHDFDSSMRTAEAALRRLSLRS